MKVISATICHYGSEFLWYALKSVENHVDEMLILYSSHPTFGHQGKIQNPDSRDELKAIADRFEKSTWIDIGGPVSQENIHRNMYYNYANSHDYDQILILDSDEVWEPDKLGEALTEAASQNEYRIAIGGNQWITFYKTFDEYVQDGFYPIRIINLHGLPNTQKIIHKGLIYHCGYMVSQEMMEYKWSCHGHKDELNPNFLGENGVYAKYNKKKYDDWVNSPDHIHDVHYNLHPVAKGIWIYTKPFDKKTLPHWFKDHPKY